MSSTAGMFARKGYACALLLLYSINAHAASPAMVDVTSGQCVDTACSADGLQDGTSLIQTKMIQTQQHKAGDQTYVANHAQINDGMLVPVTAFPWVVLIAKRNTKSDVLEPYCVATSMGGKWLLTAKHCGDMKPDEEWDLVVGKGCKPAEDQKIEKEGDCTKVFSIEKWHKDFDQDIAVIKLTEDLGILTTPKLSSTPYQKFSDPPPKKVTREIDGHLRVMPYQYGLGYCNGNVAQGMTQLRLGMTKLTHQVHREISDWDASLKNTPKIALSTDCEGVSKLVHELRQKEKKEGELLHETHMSEGKLLCGLPFDPDNSKTYQAQLGSGKSVGKYAEGDSGSPLLGGTLAFKDGNPEAPVGTQTQVGVHIGAYKAPETQVHDRNFEKRSQRTWVPLFVDVASFYDEICETCGGCQSCKADQTQEDQPIEDDKLPEWDYSTKALHGHGESEAEKEPLGDQSEPESEYEDEEVAEPVKQNPVDDYPPHSHNDYVIDDDVDSNSASGKANDGHIADESDEEDYGYGDDVDSNSASGKANDGHIADESDEEDYGYGNGGFD